MTTVWIADDDVYARERAQNALGGGGYRVKTFASGEKLLAALEREKCDAVITDFQMPPGKNGIRVLYDVRAKYPEMPVIVWSNEDSIASEVVSYGGVFIPKSLTDRSFILNVRLKAGVEP